MYAVPEPCVWAISWRPAAWNESFVLLAKAGRLEFVPLDTGRFPCVRLAYDALRLGGTAATVLNAANEVAVEAFLDGCLAFTDIPRVIEDVLGKARIGAATTLGDITEADSSARVAARERIARFPLQRTAVK